MAFAMIPFNAQLYSQHKYIEEEHSKFLVEGTFVRFTILEGGRIKLGMIKKIEGDVIHAANIKTGGWHAFKKSSIYSIFLTKVRGKLRNKLLNIMDKVGDSPVGYLDTAIDHMTAIVRRDNPHIIIEDIKTDTRKVFSRQAKFTNGDKFIKLEIPVSLDKIIITSSLTTRRSSIRLHNGRLNINVVLYKIEQIK